MSRARRQLSGHASHAAPRASTPPGSGFLPTETLEKFLIALRAGLFRGAAARLAGLSPTTVEEWIKRGRGQRPRPATPPYVEFARAVQLAEAQAYAQVSAHLFERTRYDTHAALTWLRTRHPHEWPRNPGGVPAPQRPRPDLAPATALGEDIVYLPFDAIRPAIRQYLAEKREARHAVDSAAESQAEPDGLDISDRLKRAGLRIDAE